MSITPTQMTATVTLSNGRTVEFSIDMTTKPSAVREAGDLYAALLPAGPLLGELTDVFRRHATEVTA